ncbi:MAG: PilZ domain-containing protein [Polyangia bacterium]
MTLSQPADGAEPVSLRCQLGYPDLETFIVSYGHNLSAGGLFLPMSAPPPVGTRVRFELLLMTAQAALRGEGEVTWTSLGTGGLSGLGLRLTALDGPSRRVLGRALAHKAAHLESYYKAAPDPFATDSYRPALPPPPAPPLAAAPPPPAPPVAAPPPAPPRTAAPIRTGPEEAELVALLQPRRPSLPGPRDRRELAEKLDGLLRRRA